MAVGLCKVCGAVTSETQLCGSCSRKSSEEVRAIMALKRLSDDQRVEIFKLFCRRCGSEDPHCSCMRDE